MAVRWICVLSCKAAMISISMPGAYIPVQLTVIMCVILSVFESFWIAFRHNGKANSLYAIILSETVGKGSKSEDFG